MKNVIYSCDQSWHFSIITRVFSVTWSFRNHSNMLICCLRNIYYVIHLKPFKNVSLCDAFISIYYIKCRFCAVCDRMWDRAVCGCIVWDCTSLILYPPLYLFYLSLLVSQASVGTASLSLRCVCWTVPAELWSQDCKNTRHHFTILENLAMVCFKRAVSHKLFVLTDQMI